MKKNDCNIPFITQFLGWSLAGVVLLYFFKESLEYPSWKCFLEKQGSLIGAFIGAVVLAGTVVYTIKRQTENVQMQIESSRRSLELQEFRSNVDKMSYITSEMSLHVLAANPEKVGVLVNQLQRINRKVKVVPESLFNNYRYAITVSTVSAQLKQDADSLLIVLSEVKNMAERGHKDEYSKKLIAWITKAVEKINEPNKAYEVIIACFFDLQEDLVQRIDDV